MSRLQNLLVERYAEHYTQVNRSINPAVITPRGNGILELLYGKYIATLPAGSRVLDVGCGTGILLNWLSRQPGIIASGIDASPTQVELARRCIPDIDITCVDGLAYLREHPQTFNGIFCIDILEHVPDDDLRLEWVEAIHAALKPGGFLYVRIPNAANLTASYSLSMDLTHHRIFANSSLKQLLEAGGFVNCHVVPERAPHLSGRVRLKLETWLHKIVFRICGRGQETVFTRNLHFVGYART